MNTELDPNIAALFQEQSEPPNGEQFVRAVSDRIIRERRLHLVSEAVLRRMPTIVLMAVIPMIVTILGILADRLKGTFSGMTVFAPNTVAWILPGLLCFALILLYVSRLFQTTVTE